MANYTNLKSAIQQVVKTNGNNEITGALLQQTLFAMVNSLGGYYQFAGTATPSTNPGTPDQNVFYLASTAGTYTNFGGLVLADGEIAILKYNGAWSKDSSGAASLEKVGQLEARLDGLIDGTLTPVFLFNGYINNAGYISADADFTCVYIPVTGINKVLVSYTDAATVRVGFYETIPDVGDTTGVEFLGAPGGVVTVPAGKNYLIASWRTSNITNGITFASDGRVDKLEAKVAALESEMVGVVKNTPQTFTDSQKQQARNNIGAADAETVSELESDTIKAKFLGNVFSKAELFADGKYLATVTNNKIVLYDNASYKTYRIKIEVDKYVADPFFRFFCAVAEDGETAKSAVVENETLFNASLYPGAYYLYFSVNLTIYPDFKVCTGDVVVDELVKSADITITKINLSSPFAADAVSKENADFYGLGANLFNANATDIRTGGFYHNNEWYDNANYNSTGKIAVKPNTTYICSTNGISDDSVYQPARYIQQYNEQGEYITGQDIEYGTIFTTGANTYFVTIGVNVNLWNKFQVEEGRAATRWQPYKETLKDDSFDAVVLSRFENGNRAFNALSGSATLAQNNSLTLRRFFINRNIFWSAILSGSISSFRIGLGYNEYSGMWFEVDGTQVKVYYRLDSTTLLHTYTHGLTLGAYLSVSYSDNGNGSAVFRMESYGNVFEQTITDKLMYGAGPCFVTNTGASNIDAKLSVFPKDINKRIWLFGDSYLSFLNPERWPYYLESWGFKEYLMDNLPGEAAPGGFIDFQTLVTMGMPSYIVWGFGMNGGSDPDENTPKSDWLDRETRVIAYCEKVGIVPILATIPTVPTRYHEGKNKWIRESGYRYIDFAKAVNAQANGTWATGCLSADGVHPSVLGAIALANQVISDFPEITLK